MSGPVLEARELAVVHAGAAKPALDLHRLAIEAGEFLTLVGPNGSGKSTLLRTLGLLFPPSRGELHFHGERVDFRQRRRLLAQRRRMCAVMQEPLLCRMSVYQNAALGLRYRRLPAREIERRVVPWLERLHIASLRERPARQLSGGEAQRTSLARALAVEPELLFLDEPFAALDAPTRQALLADCKEILGEARVTTVFATHDRGEALGFGGRIAVLMQGRLAQLGPAEEAFMHPANEAVARFLGVETLIPGRVTGSREGLVQVESDCGQLEVAGSAAPGEAVVVCVRPEEITLLAAGAPPASSARNQLAGRVVKTVATESLFRVEVDCGLPVIATVTRPAFRELGLGEGRQVRLAFKATAAHLIRRPQTASQEAPGPSRPVR